MKAYDINTVKRPITRIQLVPDVNPSFMPGSATPNENGSEHAARIPVADSIALVLNLHLSTELLLI